MFGCAWTMQKEALGLASWERRDRSHPPVQACASAGTARIPITSPLPPPPVCHHHNTTCSSPTSSVAPHLLCTTVLVFLVGYHWSDASPHLVFFSSTASSSSSSAAGSSSRSPAVVALSPNISFVSSQIPATSTVLPVSPTSNPGRRRWCLAAMRDDFDLGRIGANNTGCCEHEDEHRDLDLTAQDLNPFVVEHDLAAQDLIPRRRSPKL
nr:unnamed protein product [Digitaria exilis]